MSASSPNDANKIVDESAFYANFVAGELSKRNLEFKPLNEEYINSRLSDCMAFVNGIHEEYKDKYPLWTPKPKEWFLNPMNRKWEFSFVFENKNNQIVLFCFTSVYGDSLHGHCLYIDKKYRHAGLGRLKMIKICQKGLDLGFQKFEDYVDINNNASIIFQLRMGMEIKKMRKKEQLLIVGDLLTIRNRAFDLYRKEANID